jgi:hypothetical protein
MSIRLQDIIMEMDMQVNQIHYHMNEVHLCIDAHSLCL